MHWTVGGDGPQHRLRLGQRAVMGAFGAIHVSPDLGFVLVRRHVRQLHGREIDSVWVIGRGGTADTT